MPDDPAGPGVRKPGGGRKKTETQQPDMIEQVQRVIDHRTAGDPMRHDLMWTDLTPQEIADALHEHDLSIGPRMVRRILDTLGFARRQIAKVLPGGQTPDRVPQFRHLAHLTQDFQGAGNPILSIDTKKILDQVEQDQTLHTHIARGDVHLVRHLAGYKKIRYHTHENIGYGPIHLPDQEMHTTATWWQVIATSLHQAFEQPGQALDGFLGAAYAMHHIAALLAMTEPYDLRRAIGNSDTTWCASVGPNGHGQMITNSHTETNRDQISQRQFQPTVFLYDTYPGGIGLSALLYELRHDIVQHAWELVDACECAHGCPACIGPILASDEQRSNAPKHLTLTVLSLLAQGVERESPTEAGNPAIPKRANPHFIPGSGRGRVTRRSRRGGSASPAG